MDKFYQLCFRRVEGMELHDEGEKQSELTKSVKERKKKKFMKKECEYRNIFAIIQTRRIITKRDLHFMKVMVVRAPSRQRKEKTRTPRKVRFSLFKWEDEEAFHGCFHYPLKTKIALWSHELNEAH